MELPLPESLNNQRSSFLFYELKRLFREGFITNLTEQDIEQSFLHVVGLAENYLPTMRDVKRFMSAFCASYLPLQKNVKFSDFFIVSLLKYAEPNIYERLKLKDFFDIVSDFAYDYRNIYILKADEKHMKQPYFDALRLMFPQHTSGDLESMNKKGCNLKKILIGVSVGVMILASVVGVYLYVNRFDASKYVQAVLDVSYKNKTTLYQEVADVKRIWMRRCRGLMHLICRIR